MWWQCSILFFNFLQNHCCQKMCLLLKRHYCLCTQHWKCDPFLSSRSNEETWSLSSCLDLWICSTFWVFIIVDVFSLLGRIVQIFTVTPHYCNKRTLISKFTLCHVYLFTVLKIPHDCMKWVLTICQTCMMLSSDTEQMTHGSLGFQEKSEIFAVCPPWMNYRQTEHQGLLERVKFNFKQGPLFHTSFCFDIHNALFKCVVVKTHTLHVFSRTEHYVVTYCAALWLYHSYIA